MRVTATSLVLASALCAGMAGAQTSDPEPLPGNPPFTYPKKARDLGIAGEVSFRVEVDASGTVTGVKVLAVPAAGMGFEEAAEATLRRWRFRPATKDGTAVPGVHAGAITFRLSPPDEEKIRTLVSRFVEAFNAGRKEALAPLLDPEFGVRTTGRLVGPAAIEWIGSQGGAGTRLGTHLSRITFMAPDLADLDIAIGPPAAASAEVARTTWGALVARTGGDWRFMSISEQATGAAGVRRVGGEIKHPRLMKNVPPVYPPSAREARIQGTVILECLIGKDGKVEDVAVLRGHPLLRTAATDAVSRWQYAPTFVNGVPVPVTMTVTLNFHLH